MSLSIRTEECTFEFDYQRKSDVTCEKSNNGMLPRNGITYIMHGHDGSGSATAMLHLVSAVVVAIVLRLPAANYVWLRRSHSRLHNSTEQHFLELIFESPPAVLSAHLNFDKLRHASFVRCTDL